MKASITYILIFMIPMTVFSQVSISSDNTPPDPSAMLDIKSSTKGILIPRMDSIQRKAILEPAPGLMIFDSTTMSFWYYEDSWKEGLGTDDKDWKRNGNMVFNDIDSIIIGSQDANADFQIAEGKNVLFGEDLTGTGFKAIYYSNKGAFRFGYLSNPFGGYNYDKFWDYDSVGDYSFAGGYNSQAKGFGAFAFGSYGWADGSGSVAFFGHAKGNNSYTFGGNSKGRGSFTVEGTAEDEGGIAMYGYTAGRYGVAIGGGTAGLGASNAHQDYGVAIGWNSDARGQASIALGPSDAYGYNAFSTGWVTEARGNYSSTFGYRTNSYPYASMALGRYNQVTGDSASWVSTDPIFIIGDGTSNTIRSNSFLIQKNGQTAIGYDVPTGMLNISSELGNINNGGALETNKASLLIGTSTAGMAFDPNQIETVGSTLNFNFSSSENVTLVNGGGNVGIGTTTPDTKMEVENASGVNVRLTSNDGGDVIFDFKRVGSDWRINNDGGLLLFGQSADDLTTVTNILRLGGGSVTPASDNTVTLGQSSRRWTAVWAVDGTINTSDKRLKKNIRPVNKGLETVMKLKPIRFQWKNDRSEYAQDRLGFLAQDLQKVIPEVVVDHEWREVSDSKDKEWVPTEYLGVKYAELTPVLVQAIQELKSENDLLRSELNAIKKLLSNQELTVK